MELVQGGVQPHVLRRKKSEVILNTVIPSLIPGGQDEEDIGASNAAAVELCRAACYAVQSGADKETVRALLDDDEYDARWYIERMLTRVDHDDEDEDDEHQQSLLHHAAINGAGPEVVQLILSIDRRLSLNLARCTDDEGCSPLHHAAMTGASTDVVRRLLRHHIASPQPSL